VSPKGILVQQQGTCDHHGHLAAPVAARCRCKTDTSRQRLAEVLGHKPVTARTDPAVAYKGHDRLPRLPHVTAAGPWPRVGLVDMHSRHGGLRRQVRYPKHYQVIINSMEHVSV
jgi:hypothetical protein